MDVGVHAGPYDRRMSLLERIALTAAGASTVA
jgi:hypothetical protein